jgi:hypothetical protein
LIGVANRWRVESAFQDVTAPNDGAKFDGRDVTAVSENFETNFLFCQRRKF